MLRYLSTIGEAGDDLVNEVEEFGQREETTPNSSIEDFKLKASNFYSKGNLGNIAILLQFAI